MYMGVLVGVLFSAAIDRYKSGQAILPALSPTVLLISAVIALMLIPPIYQRLSIRPCSPFIVQLGVFVQSGVFWEAIVSSAAKALVPR